MKCYWMLQNVRVPPFAVSALLRENQWMGGSKITPTQIRVKYLKLELKKNVISTQVKKFER